MQAPHLRDDQAISSSVPSTQQNQALDISPAAALHQYTQNTSLQTAVQGTEAEATNTARSPDASAAERSFLLSVTPSAESSPEQIAEPPDPAALQISDVDDSQRRISGHEDDSAVSRSFLFSPASSQLPSPIDGSTTPAVLEKQGGIEASYSPTSLGATGPADHPGVSAGMASETQRASRPSKSRPFVGYEDLKFLNPSEDAKTTQEKGRNFSWKGPRYSIANISRAGSNGNLENQVPVSTAATAEGPEKVAPWTKEMDTNKPSTEHGSARHQTALPQLVSRQPGRASAWSSQQVRKSRAQNVVPMQESTSMKNIPAAATTNEETLAKNKSKNSFAPHRQLFQPLTSRLPKSYTLANLGPSRQSQEISGGYRQNSLWINKGGHNKRDSRCGEKENQEISEDLTVNLHVKGASDKEQNATGEAPSLQHHESETQDSISHPAEDVRTVRDFSVVCVTGIKNCVYRGFEATKQTGTRANFNFPFQVTSAQPPEYWLGRLTTLVNAFQHEEGFNEPDPAIKYDYSKPGRDVARLLLTRNCDENRAKRALITLQRLCKTPEAKASFDKFRESYSKCFGRGWASWFSDIDTDGDPRCNKSGSLPAEAVDSTKGELSKGKGNSSGRWGPGELGVINIFRSVRRSLG